MEVIEASIVFCIRKDDWREEIIMLPSKQYWEDKEKYNLYKLDDDEYSKANQAYNDDQDRVTVHQNKDREGTTRRIKWKEFDPRKMTIVLEDKTARHINLKEIIESGKAPGTLTTRHDGDRGSLFHNHKLDEGAMGDLLDKGLDGAVKRAEERESKLGKGHAFQKKSFGRRRKGHGKRK